MFNPFNFHWYWGFVPPLTGVAVKLPDCPMQMGLAAATILTLTGRNGLTIIVTEFDVAGFPVVHMAFDVRMQVTISLFKGV